MRWTPYPKLMPVSEPPPSEMNDGAVDRRVAAEFASTDAAPARAELARIDGSPMASALRLRHAVLTLAGGDLGRLRHYAAAARADCRDVIYWAYWPDESTASRPGVA